MTARDRHAVRRLATRAGRVVAGLVAVALVAIPVAVTVATAAGSTVRIPRGVFGYPPANPVPSDQSAAAQSLVQSGCPGANSAIVVGLLNSVDVMAGTVTANMSMCMGSNVARQVLKEAQYHPSITISMADQSLTINLVRVARLASEHPLVPAGTLPIPINGYPRMYPLDHYLAQMGVGIGGELPPFARVRLFSFQWFVAPTAAALNWGVSVNEGDAPPGVGEDMALVAQRPAAVKLFVWVIVAIPLLLIVLLSTLLWQRPSGSIDGLVGVIAIMLAILPIRAVLVPGEITSLTVVDFALATEMALLAAGTIIWFARPGHKTPAAAA